MKRVKNVPESTLPIKHVHHNEHLCVLAAKRQMGKVAKLVKDAKYICKVCGRVAEKERNLCEPVEIP